MNIPVVIALHQNEMPLDAPRDVPILVQRGEYVALMSLSSMLETAACGSGPLTRSSG